MMIAPAGLAGRRRAEAEDRRLPPRRLSARHGRAGGYRAAVAAKRSAGILLYRRDGGEVELLLVHPGGPYWAKRDLGAWTIPKGEIEAGRGAARLRPAGAGEELGTAPDLDARGADRRSARCARNPARWSKPGRPRATSTRRGSTATASRWSGRRAAAASASSPRSTGPSGSTPSWRGEDAAGPGRADRPPARAPG